MNQPASISKYHQNNLEDHLIFDPWPMQKNHGWKPNTRLLLSAVANRRKSWKDLGSPSRTCASITFQRSWCWCYLVNNQCCLLFFVGRWDIFFEHFFSSNQIRWNTNSWWIFGRQRDYDLFCLKLAASDVGWILKKELLHLTGVKGWWRLNFWTKFKIPSGVWKKQTWDAMMHIFFL